jgi:hypothetical protein
MAYPTKNTSTYTAPTKNSSSISLEAKNTDTYTSPSKNSSSFTLDQTDRHTYDESEIEYDSLLVKYDDNISFSYETKH